MFQETTKKNVERYYGIMCKIDRNCGHSPSKQWYLYTISNIM